MAMAEMEREATFSDKSKQRSFADVFFHQKQSCLFCDVILKVCSKEIYAHSNVLAASSPYFENFLSQDLPRLFSQRSPQIIEIQIDGNEPNKFYEEAVATVIDFIYTGNITVKEYNVAQIYEISKIMEVISVINFCEDFIQGKVQHGMIYQGSDGLVFRSVPSNTDITSVKYGSMLDCWATISKSARAEKDAALLSKIKTRKVTSVSVQTVPIVPINKTVSGEGSVENEGGATFVVEPLNRVTFISAPKRRGRPPTKHKLKLSEEGQSSPKKPKVFDQDIKETVSDKSDRRIQDVKSFTTRSGRKVIAKIYPDQEYISKIEPLPEEISTPLDEKVETVIDNSDLNYEMETDLNEITLNISETERTDVENAEQLEVTHELLGNDSEQIHNIETSEKEEDITDLEKQTEQRDDIHVVISNSAEDTDLTLTLSKIGNMTMPTLNNPLMNQNVQKQMKQMKKYTRRIMTVPNKTVKKPPRNYTCSECEYVTKSVREMTNHTMTHKIEKGICFYCDIKIADRCELLDHLKTHSGDKPFQCRECKMEFKTRTMMNLHLPKHSNYKPFVCHICSMSFKWKHALTCHFTTHSGKKEHLCDICGFTTAWKSQLKAHKLIHFDMTFKCDKPGCGFQTTKKQNLKYHEVTHTGERKNMCEICGQKFSLKRNMRRHMLLHFTNKQHKCDSCEFASTRMDKLKEHMFKQHGKGTPPERRFKIAELQQTQNLTISATGNFISIPDPPEGLSEDGGQQTEILFSEANMTSAIEAGLTTVTQTLGGDVITIIKEPEQDSYAILNNLLNNPPDGSGDGHVGKNVIIQREDVGKLSTLQEFTSQQMEANEENQHVIAEQVISIAPDQGAILMTSGENGDAQTFEIISEDAMASLADNPSLSGQTIQIIENDQMQFVKVEDLAARLNLPEGFTLAPVSVTGQPLQIIREAVPHSLQHGNITTANDSFSEPASTLVEQIVVQPQSETVHDLGVVTSDITHLVTSESGTVVSSENTDIVTSATNCIMTSDHTGIVTSMNQVLIQRPDGSEVPVEFIK